MKRFHTYTVLALVLSGLLRWPLESSIKRDLKTEGFQTGLSTHTGNLREQLGQLSMATALGGMRSFLATIFEFRAITAFVEADFDRVETNYHLATQLQPKESGYWEKAAWMLESNAAAHYLHYAPDLSEFERQRIANQKRERGRVFLEDGLTYNPDSEALNLQMALFFRERQSDYARAADFYGKAAALMGGDANQAARAEAIMLSLCPGKEREALEKLRRLAVILTKERGVPPWSVLLHLKYLEKLLKIPKIDQFNMPLNFMRLYVHLGSQFDLARASRMAIERLRRLETILEIPADRRISLGAPLAPPGR